MDHYKILGRRWWTPKNDLIGIVAVETYSETGEWKAYIGRGRGFNEDEDAQHIASWGAGLQPEEAKNFFPHLDIEKYKQE